MTSLNRRNQMARMSLVAMLSASVVPALFSEEKPAVAAETSWAQRAYQNARPGQTYYNFQAAVEGITGWSYTPPPPPRSHQPSSITQNSQGASQSSQSYSAPPQSSQQYTPAPSQTSQSRQDGAIYNQQGSTPPPSANRSQTSQSGSTTGRKLGKSKPAPAPSVVESSKGVIEPPVVIEPVTGSKVQLSLSTGYYSHYMMRGLDVGYRTGIDQNNDSDFAGTNLNLSVGNFSVGFAYWHSLDSYIPNGAGFDGSFGKVRNGQYVSDETFETPARERYQEYNLLLNYSYPITEDLAITAGASFMWFNDGRFWANSNESVDSTVEVVGGLTYTGIPYLNQSLFYYHDIDAFEGGFLEYRVSSVIPVYQRGKFAVALVPSLTLGYDFEYNGPDNGWNSIEPGLDIPIRITDGLTFNLGVRYNLDLGDDFTGTGGRSVDRTDDRLWFTAALQFSFPNGETLTPAPISGKGGKYVDSAVFTPIDPGRWSLVAGAGVRNVSADFDVKRAPNYPIHRLFNQRRGGGDLGFAGDGRSVNYLNGSVGATEFFDGTTGTFTVNSASQFNDYGLELNRQVTFNSQRYAYNTTSTGSGFKSSDEDEVVYPYVELSYRVADFNRFSVGFGLGYSFSSAEMDSGTKIVGLQTASERHDNYFFTYDFDEIYSSLANPDFPYSGDGAYYLILDGQAYQDAYQEEDGDFEIVVPFSGPQENKISTARELARVAAFRASTLDVDLHSISAPIDVSFAITDRISAKLSFGPTLNVFNVDLKTDTYYQLLDPQGGVKVSGSGRRNVAGVPYLRNNSTGEVFLATGGSTQGNPPNTSDFTTAGSASSSSANVSTQSTSVPDSSGGKGAASGKSRKLPGTTIAHYTNRYSDQEFQWGVFGELALQADLDDRKRWFLEAFVRYDYISPFTVSDGAASAEIDASSWGAGIGLGFRF